VQVATASETGRARSRPQRCRARGDGDRRAGCTRRHDRYAGGGRLGAPVRESRAPAQFDLPFGDADRTRPRRVNVNTLALAYAGAALPLLILFVQSRQSLGTVANSETVVTEILSALIGSVGIVASVPLTTWLASRVVGEPGTTGRRRRGTAPTRRPQPQAPPADTESEFWDGPSDEYPALPRSPAPRGRERD
jgi:hypothetical protein